MLSLTQKMEFTLLKQHLFLFVIYKYAGKSSKTIFEQQTQLIESVKKNQGNQLITEITVQTKALRKPQDKLIKQLTDAVGTANT